MYRAQNRLNHLHWNQLQKFTLISASYPHPPGGALNSDPYRTHIRSSDFLKVQDNRFGSVYLGAMPNKLFLLDAMALVYRAHFALVARPIFTSKGVNTSALYGFTQTLLELLNNQKPTH